MRARISAAIWEQARTAYASGIGLRELARQMGIPEGTILARASREKWTQRIETAKALATAKTRPTVSPSDAAALSLRERAERHVERMAGITEKVLPHLEAMEPAEILNRARELERFDFTARRNYSLDHQPLVNGPLSPVLITHSAVQIVSPSERASEQSG